MEDYRRKKYLIKKGYQLRYTAVLLAAMLVMAVVLMAVTYWDISRSLSIPDMSIALSWDKYIVRIVLLLVAAFLGGVFLSNKIIGPVHRLEEMVRNMSSGRFGGKIELRKGDEFKGLADELNLLSDKLDRISAENPELKDELSR